MLQTPGHVAGGIDIEFFRQMFKAWVMSGVQIGCKIWPTAGKK